MKHCIAVTEVLTRVVTVDTGEAGESSLDKAIERIKDAYKGQEIILDAEDLVPDQTTGELASFYVADWIDPDEMRKKAADFTI